MWTARALGPSGPSPSRRWTGSTATCWLPSATPTTARWLSATGARRCSRCSSIWASRISPTISPPACPIPRKILLSKEKAYDTRRKESAPAEGDQRSGGHPDRHPRRKGRASRRQSLCCGYVYLSLFQRAACWFQRPEEGGAGPLCSLQRPHRAGAVCRSGKSGILPGGGPAHPAAYWFLPPGPP